MSNPTIDSLRGEIRGHLITKDVPGYEEARRVYNGMIDKRPAFEAYETRLMTRPAAVRAKHTDDMLLAQQTSPQ